MLEEGLLMIPETRAEVLGSALPTPPPPLCKGGKMEVPAEGGKTRNETGRHCTPSGTG